MTRGQQDGIGHLLFVSLVIAITVAIVLFL